MKNKTYLKVLSVVSAAAVVVSGTTILGRAAGDVASEIEAYEAQAEETEVIPQIAEAPAPEEPASGEPASVNEEVITAEFVADAETSEPVEAVPETASEQTEVTTNEEIQMTVEEAADIPDIDKSIVKEDPATAEKVADAEYGEDVFYDTMSENVSDVQKEKTVETGPAASETAGAAEEPDVVEEPAVPEEADADHLVESQFEGQMEEEYQAVMRASSPAELGRDLLAGQSDSEDAEELGETADEEGTAVEDTDPALNGAAEESAENLNEAGPGSIELVGDTSAKTPAGTSTGGSSQAVSGNTSGSSTGSGGNAGGGAAPSTPAPAVVPAAIAPEETSQKQSQASKANSPKTGDSSQTAAYSLLCLAAVASAAAALGWRDETQE